MSSNELSGNEPHDITVSPRARDAWLGIPWSAEKNVIRRLCDPGQIFDVCASPELNLLVEPTLQNDRAWSDPDRLPDCVTGYHYPPPDAGEPSLLVVGFWIVLYDDKLQADRSTTGAVSLRNSYVRDIVFLRELLRDGLSW